MDWPKIKNILILVLIIVNVMLGSVIVQDQLRFEREQEANLKDVLSLFEAKGVALETEDLDDFPRQVSSIYVEFFSFTEQDISQFLNGDYGSDGEWYYYGDEVARVQDMSFIWGKKTNLSRVLQDSVAHLKWFERVTDVDRLDILKTDAEAFMTAHNVQIHSTMMSARSLGDYTVVSFREMHDDMVLEESQTVVWFYKDEVVGFKRSWPVKNSTTGSMKYGIITVDRALYSALQNFKSGDVVVDVSIVYKLNDQNLMVSDLISGEALPYYRIELSTGECYYVQAVTTP